MFLSAEEIVIKDRKDFLEFAQILDIAAVFLNQDLKVVDCNLFAARLGGWFNQNVVGQYYPSWCKTYDILPVISVKEGVASIINSFNNDIVWEIKPIKYQDDVKNKGHVLIGKTGCKLLSHDSSSVARHQVIGSIDQSNSNSDSLYKLSCSLIGYDVGSGKDNSDYLLTIYQYLENIIAKMPCYVFWKDRNFVYLGCNDLSAQLVNLPSRKDIVGKTYSDFGWDKEKVAGWRKLDQAIIETGTSFFNIEDFVLDKDGKEIILLVTKMPIFDSENNIVGIFDFSIDVTDSRSAEKLNHQEIAEKTSNFMQMLASSIAHEIKTPLAVMGINTDLLTMNPYLAVATGDDKATIDKYLKGIKHSIKLSTQMIDNIVLMLKTLSAAEHVREKFTRLSISDDLSNLLEIYPFLEHEKTLINYHNLGKKKDFIYWGDKLLTQHVLFNLIRNALHAIKEAEKGEISIVISSNPKYNILKFTDTALGIAKKYLSNIFDPFKSGKKDGAGLGLAFCKMVMRLYGGDIICESKEGEYTEFVLMFPKKLSRTSR